MPRVLIDLTIPSVLARTRSKSSSNTAVDTRSTRAAKGRTARQVDGEKAEKLLTKKRKRETELPADRKASTHQRKKEEEGVPPSTKKKRMANSPRKDEHEEKRLRVFRKQAPKSYLVRLSRANSQRCVKSSVAPFLMVSDSNRRMYIISRMRDDNDEFPQETVEIAGSTGNIYHVDIGLVPSCTCPDNENGNQCKHIIYVGTLKSHAYKSTSPTVILGSPQRPQSPVSSSIPTCFPLLRQ